MSSLYDDVKAFADRARAIMVARLAALKNEDQKSRLQGISENGELISRADGESRASHALGNTQPAPNENLYLDGTNTLDLKTKKPAKSFVRTRKKKPLELARIVDTPGKFLIASRIGPSGSSNAIIAIIDEGGGGGGEPTILIKVGSYMVSYGYGTDSGVTGESGSISATGVSGATDYVAVSTISNMGYGTGKGLFWQARAYAECGHANVFFPAYANASVSSSVGVNASASTSGSSGSYTDSDGPNYGSGFLGGNTAITADINGTISSPNFTGYYDASFYVIYEIVRNAEWYYEFSTTDGIYERSFDVDTMVSGSIVYIDCYHDYTVKEGDDYFAYAIFHVATATTGEAVINNMNYACPVSHYVVHTRVNLSNGQVSHKVNSVNFDSSEGYLFREVTLIPPVSTVDREDFYNKAFQHCYEGDWIYPWRDVRVTGESYTTINNVRLTLLGVSYKETYYWNYADSPMTDDATNDDIYRWSPIGSPEENNSPSNPTATQFAALYIEMTSSLNSLGDINDYFGPSGPAGSPRDYANWRTWNYYYLGPNFTSNITELFSSPTYSGLPTSSMGRPFFHYMPRTISSQVQLIGYSVEDVVVSQSQTVRVLYIFTSDAADFLVGDSVSITGSNVIDGSWTVYSQPEPEAKTKFGLSPAGSLTLTSYTSTSGTVTRT